MVLLAAIVVARLAVGSIAAALGIVVLLWIPALLLVRHVLWLWFFSTMNDGEIRLRRTERPVARRVTERHEQLQGDGFELVEVLVPVNGDNVVLSLPAELWHHNNTTMPVIAHSLPTGVVFATRLESGSTMTTSNTPSLSHPSVDAVCDMSATTSDLFDLHLNGLARARAAGDAPVMSNGIELLTRLQRFEQDSLQKAGPSGAREEIREKLSGASKPRTRELVR